MEIFESPEVVTLAGNKVIMEVGSFVSVIPLVLKGGLKVIRVDEDGNELFLYYIRPGETCAMSLSACLHEELSIVRAVSVEPSVILAVPVSRVSAWQIKYSTWRRFITETYDQRFREMVNTIDSIAFRKLDERLVAFLLQKSDILRSSTLHLSHQNIADELHASREVISRLLKQLERNGSIKLHRNRIEVISLM